MEVTFKRAGLLTTIQDLGRTGFRAEGVPLGGAVDPIALRVANLLVGNPEDSPALEITLVGPELELASPLLVAVCGAQFEGVASNRPFMTGADGRISFGECRKGCRAYLAVAGGFAIERVLGGAGTCLAGGFGGWQGRPIRAGDVLRVADVSRNSVGRWSVDARLLPDYLPAPTVRCLPGAQAAEFGQALFAGRFKVGAHSDRMGIRLEGLRLVRSSEAELPSTAVIPGSVQVPPDGNPIVLMADAQTLGGYPLIAHVIGADLPLLAQLRPGDTVGFQQVSLGQAHAALLDRERHLAMLRQGLAGRFD